MARTPVLHENEASPEVDRQEGVPHPRETEALFGHGAAEVSLAEAIGSERGHHAWLIAGPAGIGKATLAYRAAKFALAEPGERNRDVKSLAIPPNSQAARQVRALSHPGLLVIRRNYNLKDKRFPTSISVDEVRRLRTFLSHKAGPGAWRVVIVDRADELNINAANALLKSLEEPPERTLFFLVVSEPGRLLPTIRSRCRMLACGRLAASDLEQAVRAALEAGGSPLPPDAAWPLLERLAQGSPGRAIGLIGGGGLDLHGQITSLLSALPQVRWGEVHKLADQLSPTTADTKFALFFELLLDTLARIVRAGATGVGEKSELQLAEGMAGEARLATLAGLWETVAREKAETVALNLDRKTLILRTVSRLETATR